MQKPVPPIVCGRALSGEERLLEEVCQGCRWSLSGSGPQRRITILCGEWRTPIYLSLQRLHFTGGAESGRPKVGPHHVFTERGSSNLLRSTQQCVSSRTSAASLSQPLPSAPRAGVGVEGGQGLGHRACQAPRSVGQIRFEQN